MEEEQITLPKLPIFSDEATKEYCERSKVLILMRGLPGSGKSYLAKLIHNLYPNSTICCADDFFMKNGEYSFIKEELPKAHQSCQENATKAMTLKGDDEKNIVIIDNTNVKTWEMKWYIAAAKEHRYITLVLEPQTPWRHDPEECFKKSSHKIPFETVKRRHTEFSQTFPLYYGWFLNHDDSEEIFDKATKYFESCIREVDEFKTHLETDLKVHGDEQDNYKSITDLYGRHSSSIDTAHCTSFFALRGKLPGTKEYAENEEVKFALGRATKLTVIGFFMTPKTIGARVKLTQEQLKLWKKDDKETSGGNPPKSDGIQADLAALNINGESTSGNSRFQPTSGPGSRAHMTCKYVDGVTAMQTGLDLVDIIKCEEEYKDDPKFTEIADGAIRYYQEGRCCVYLNNPIEVDTLFTGRY